MKTMRRPLRLRGSGQLNGWLTQAAAATRALQARSGRAASLVRRPDRVGRAGLCDTVGCWPNRRPHRDGGQGPAHPVRVAQLVNQTALLVTGLVVGVQGTGLVVGVESTGFMVGVGECSELMRSTVRNLAAPCAMHHPVVQAQGLRQQQCDAQRPGAASRQGCTGHRL